MMSAVLKIIVLFVLLEQITATTENIFCVYERQSKNRINDGKFTVDNIDPKLCTHIFFSSITFSYNGTVQSKNAENLTDEIFQFNSLRNYGVKTILSIQQNVEPKLLAVMKNDTLRRNLISALVNFAQTNNFDGIDVTCSEAKGQTQNMTLFVKDFKTALENVGLILTISTTGLNINKTHISLLNSYADFINILSFDLHTPSEGLTGQTAPMNSSVLELKSKKPKISVGSIINSVINMGIIPSKVILGIASYGRSWTLSNPNQNGINAPSKGPGNPGPYTNTRGLIGYNEIIEKISRENQFLVWNSEQGVPFMYKDNQWISYDNSRSVEIKTSFAKDNYLGGVLMKSLDTDDFLGKSGEKYPLLKTINNVLKGTNDTARFLFGFGYKRRYYWC